MLTLPDLTAATAADIFQARTWAFGITGKASFFGGPDDLDGGHGVKPLALQIKNPETGEIHRAVDLDPASLYCAMRWDQWKSFRRWHGMTTYNYGLVRDDFLILVLRGGHFAAASPVDYGPAVETGNLIDLSPAFADLGVRSGEPVDLLLYDKRLRDITSWIASDIETTAYKDLWKYSKKPKSTMLREKAAHEPSPV